MSKIAIIPVAKGDVVQIDPRTRLLFGNCFMVVDAVYARRGDNGTGDVMMVSGTVRCPNSELEKDQRYAVPVSAVKRIGVAHKFPETIEVPDAEKSE